LTDYGKLKDLSFVEWFLLISAAVVLPVVAGLVKQLGFRETEKLLVRFSPGRSSQDVKEHSVDRAARMVSIAARPFMWVRYVDRLIGGMSKRLKRSPSD